MFTYVSGTMCYLCCRPLNFFPIRFSPKSCALSFKATLRLKWMRCNVSEGGNCYEPDPFVFSVDTPIIGIGFSGNFQLAVYEVERE